MNHPFGNLLGWTLSAFLLAGGKRSRSSIGLPMLCLSKARQSNPLSAGTRSHAPDAIERAGHAHVLRRRRAKSSVVVAGTPLPSA